MITLLNKGILIYTTIIHCKDYLFKNFMRNINKRSTGYKTRAELKKERKELKRKSKMETKILNI